MPLWEFDNLRLVLENKKNSQKSDMYPENLEEQYKIFGGVIRCTWEYNDLRIIGLSRQLGKKVTLLRAFKSLVFFRR